MREHPILMNGAMVRAVLAGRKTQTRRMLNPQGAADFPPDEPNLLVHLHARDCGSFCDFACAPMPCPYGAPGDRIWVRETWAYHGGDESLYQRSPNAVEYRATSPLFDGIDSIPGGRWRPSIHMPRWASRITLEITDVRVQRLQDISEGDAEAEGVCPIRAQVPTHRDAFRYLWDDISGAGAWDANPWVWAISFRRAGS